MKRYQVDRISDKDNSFAKDTPFIVSRYYFDDLDFESKRVQLVGWFKSQAEAANVCTALNLMEHLTEKEM